MAKTYAGVEREILIAAANLGERLSADFEHGQWWITDLDTGAQWSVVDTSRGYDFEQVTEGEEA